MVEKVTFVGFRGFDRLDRPPPWTRPWRPQPDGLLHIVSTFGPYVSIVLRFTHNFASLCYICFFKHTDSAFIFAKIEIISWKTNVYVTYFLTFLSFINNEPWTCEHKCLQKNAYTTQSVVPFGTYDLCAFLCIARCSFSATWKTTINYVGVFIGVYALACEQSAKGLVILHHALFDLKLSFQFYKQWTASFEWVTEVL